MCGSKMPSDMRNGTVRSKDRIFVYRETAEPFDLAADVWTQAVRLNPGGYLDIENWLKSTGRSNVDVYF